MTVTELIKKLQFMFDLYKTDNPVYIRDESGFRYNIRECEEYETFYVLEPELYDNN